VICELNNRHPQLVKGTVARVLEGSAGESAVQRLRNHIGTCLDRQLRDLASDLAGKDGDIPDLFDAICQSFSASERSVKTINQVALKELAQALAINTSPNVVKLPRPAVR
jgi:hypothetical protein